MLINSLIKFKTTMDEEKKCNACGHEHKNTDGSCSCGCEKK